MPDPLSPSLIGFFPCQRVDRDADGSLSFRGVSGTLTVPRGNRTSFGVLVATVWAGIPGEYRQSLELANADGQGLALRRRGFSIPYRMGRIVLQTPIAIPAVPGEYLLRVALDDVVVSAQTVRVEAR